ncbi:MAG: hypothetical protein LBI72_12500 [Flavobacteriaceae bacterium]|jgi:hypothetical protein|nr:hypothetical protein [Flavobacteriaceae bacterium]
MKKRTKSKSKNILMNHLLHIIFAKLIIETIITEIENRNIYIPAEVLSLVVNPKTIRTTALILVKMLRFVCRITYKQYRYLLMIWKTKKNRIK